MQKGGKIIGTKLKAAHVKAGPNATVKRQRRRDKKRCDSKKVAAVPATEAKEVKVPKAMKVQPKAKAGKPEEPKLSKKELKMAAGFERRHRALYDVGQKVLLVGEGNFSFARALCANLCEGDKKGGENVYATCHDSEADLDKKYSDAAALRKELEDEFNATTLTSVDARRIHNIKEFRGHFQRIIWNFPHMGGNDADVEQSIRDHKALLIDFFKDAEKCLSEDEDAAIHVALKEGEPCKSWKIVQSFRAACPDMDLKEVRPFGFGAWPGYEFRRTAGFDSRHSKKDRAELAKGAKIYVFVRKAAMPGKKRKGD